MNPNTVVYKQKRAHLMGTILLTVSFLYIAAQVVRWGLNGFSIVGY